MNKTPNGFNIKKKNLPASPTPKQFEILQRKNDYTILLHFITKINNKLNKGNNELFTIPGDAYTGFIIDVNNHFKEYGWEAKLFGSRISLSKIKEG